MEKTFKVIGRDINTNEKINGIGFKSYDDKLIIIKEDLTEHIVSRDSFRIIGYDMPGEFENKPISIMQVYELHNALMKTTIDYLRNQNIKDIDEIMFYADGLLESVKYGKWNAYTDSNVTLFGYENNKRKIAGYSI
jgi:hypothetical protein